MLELDVRNLVGDYAGKRVFRLCSVYKAPCNKDMAARSGKGVYFIAVQYSDLVAVVNVGAGGINRNGGANIIQVRCQGGV